MKTFHLKISGKVQGVFYRSSAKEMAVLYNVTGWVRNDVSGMVEAMVTGNEKDLKNFIRWCKSGPKRAAVENVVIVEMPCQSFETFEILR
jgi:acylphosphatase